MATTLLQTVSAAASIKGQVDQSRGIRKQNRLAKQRANLEAKRARRNQLRQVRIAQADALSAGVSRGAQNSSGVAGGRASVQSQGNSNILGINQGQELGVRNFEAQSLINRGQGLSTLGNTLFNRADDISSIFGS